MQEDNIKYFDLNNISIEHDLIRVAREKGIQLRSEKANAKGDDYYPQVPEKIRRDAEIMAEHYEVFDCLEISIRDLIRARLEDDAGEDWWNTKVPQTVRDNAGKNKRREVQSGVTPRSDDLLSYTNFGELAEIIKFNWGLFRDTFTDIRAVESTLARLNTLRAPIAHCSMLAEDEVVRLRLSLRDWFRLME